jgi:hypothetical protein
LKAREYREGTKAGDKHENEGHVWSSAQLLSARHSIAFPMSSVLPQNNFNSTALPSYDYPRLDSVQQWCVKDSEKYDTGIEAVDQTELYVTVFAHSSLFRWPLHQQQANGYPTLGLGPFSSVCATMLHLLSCFLFHNFRSRQNAWDMNFGKDCSCSTAYAAKMIFKWLARYYQL